MSLKRDFSTAEKLNHIDLGNGRCMLSCAVIAQLIAVMGYSGYYMLVTHGLYINIKRCLILCLDEPKSTWEYRSETCWTKILERNATEAVVGSVTLDFYSWVISAWKFGEKNEVFPSKKAKCTYSKKISFGDKYVHSAALGYIWRLWCSLAAYATIKFLLWWLFVFSWFWHYWCVWTLMIVFCMFTCHQYPYYNLRSVGLYKNKNTCGSLHYLF